MTLVIPPQLHPPLHFYFHNDHFGLFKKISDYQFEKNFMCGFQNLGKK